MAHARRREAGHEAAAPAALGLVDRRRHRLARSGVEPRRAGPSRAGEADGEKQQVNLASSRAGAEDIGEREGVVHVEATPHGRRVEVARRHGCAWRAR
jgi:hypothetical protein